MYQINRQKSKPGYCVLSQARGVSGLLGGGLKGCLTLFIVLMLIPILAGFCFWVYIEFKESDYLRGLIPVSLTLLLFTIRWLVVWPKLPARLVFDSSTQQIHVLDRHDDDLATSPSMSYSEINSILVHTELNRSEDREYRRYKIVLQKSDTSSWLLLGGFTGQKQAESALSELLELVQWSPDQGVPMGEAHTKSSPEDNEDHSRFNLGQWHLPKRVISSENFNFERLDELSKITWQTQHPPGRKMALSVCTLALSSLGLGLLSYSLMFKVFAAIPLGLAVLIFRSLSRWHSQQEIRIYRDRIELSSKHAGELISLKLDELRCLAFDLNEQNLQLRFVKHEDFKYINQLNTKDAQVSFAEYVEAMKIMLKSIQVYVAYMDASDILRLEQLIQSEVQSRANEVLA